MFSCLRTVYCVCFLVFVLCIDKQTYTIHSTKTNKHTQYTVRRQTNIHNTQYEDKQTYTMHSTKTNKHRQHTVFVCLRTVYCVCLFVSVLCVVYACLSSYCVCLFVFVACILYVCLSSYCVLCMLVCLRTVYCVCLFVLSIHNTQYEDKQTYTIHSTKTSKHTQKTQLDMSPPTKNWR
jgi:hypothetical protein